MRRMEILTKQLEEINKQSQKSSDKEILKTAKVSHESEKDLETSNDEDTKQNQLEEVRRAMAKTYQKQMQEKKKTGAKKKKKKKKSKSKQKNVNTTQATPTTSSITKGVPD